MSTPSGWLHAVLRSVGRERDPAATFEHVDSARLHGGDFRVSDSIGLDGAPSMVFCGAMPPYAHDVDRPSRSDH